MDYLLWLILLFLGMFMKCLGVLLAFGVAYYVFLKIAPGNDKNMELAREQFKKGDK